MKFLRTTSTRRLLATLAGLLVAIGGGTAIAVAAGSGGPVPPPSSLAGAVHQGLSGPKLTGFSADITFTNHLIPAANLQGGGDPLLSGGSGHLWFSPAQHRLRIALFSTGGAPDPQIVVNGRSFWISDPSANIVYAGTLPAAMGAPATGRHLDRDKTAGAGTTPSLGRLQSYITKLLAHLDLNGAGSGRPSAIPGDVGGRPTYSLRLSPKHDGGLLGAAQVAWDAIYGVPLDFAIYASNDSTPVIELRASNISYGAVPASDFAVTPPSGSKTITVVRPSSHAGGAEPGRHNVLTGLEAVAASLPFKLTAPATAAGLPRQSVAKLAWGGDPAAVVTYGQGIGAIAVIERLAAPAASSGVAGSGQLSLPTVSIAGNTAHELDAALGTVLTFDHGSVSYVVIGSVPPTAAEAAATDIAKAP